MKKIEQLTREQYIALDLRTLCFSMILKTGKSYESNIIRI